MTSPRAARLQRGSSGSTSPRSPHRRAPAQARPPRAARPRPGRIPPAPGRAPRAPSASRPPAPPPSRARGWGNRGRRRLLRPLPLARPLPPSSPCCSRFLPLGLSRPVKVLPNFSSPSGLSGRRQRAGCCAPARSAAGPPGSGARGAADTKWPLAVLPPSHLSHPVRPHLLPRDSPGLRWLSSPAPCVPARTLAPGSQRKPPSPFASSGSYPPPLLRQPLESIPWGIGALPPRRRAALPCGTPGHRRGHVSR